MSLFFYSTVSSLVKVTVQRSCQQNTNLCTIIAIVLLDEAIVQDRNILKVAIQLF